MSKKKAKKKIKFNVEDVLRARLVLRACNKFDLDDLEFVDDNGNPVKPSDCGWRETVCPDGKKAREELGPMSIEDFKFIGLSNWDYVQMAFCESFGEKYAALARNGKEWKDRTCFTVIKG